MPSMTPAQAREELKRRGLSISDWARANKLDYMTVYRVITGKVKGNYGEAHNAAVLLGLKEGVVFRDGEAIERIFDGKNDKKAA